MVLLCLVGMSSGVNVGTAEETPAPGLERHVHGSQEVIVQIGGRLCEYHRSEVEGALRQHEAVERVEFLNQHGTVLVHYRPGTIEPAQFADSVERALSANWNCKAWVDRGQDGGKR
jgi:hypothetical protein